MDSRRSDGGAQIHYATDGRDLLINDPNGWEVDQPWLWWEGPADGSPTPGPWGNPPPGAEFGAPSLRGTSLPAVTRCVALIADKIASMPWKVYRGREQIDTPAWILDPQAAARDGRRPELGGPDIRFSGVEYWTQYITSLLLWGEGIAFTPRVRDAFGQPTGAIVAPAYIINPRNVDVSEDGAYVIDPDDGGGVIELDSRELIVTRSGVRPGKVRGLGVIQSHAADLAGGAAVRAYADNLLQRGVPNGYLKSSKPDLDQAQATKLRLAWEGAHGDIRKSIAVLNSTTEFTPLSIDPQAMQYVEMKRLSAWDIALIFGVPPSKLGINMGQSNTYSNLESENAAFVQDCLIIFARKIEAAIDAVLPAGTTLKIDFNQLLRGDTTTRFNAYQIGIAAGFLTVDEVRGFEDLPPLTNAQITANDAARRTTSEVDAL